MSTEVLLWFLFSLQKETLADIVFLCQLFIWFLVTIDEMKRALTINKLGHIFVAFSEYMNFTASASFCSMATAVASLAASIFWLMDWVVS